jgi:hypothetical protein
MRQMRGEARELAQKQGDIGEKLDALADNKRKTLTDSDERKALADQLDEQKKRMTNLLSHATQITEQAENVEPLLSRQLYDTLRKASQDDAKNLTDTRDDLLSRGRLTRGTYETLQSAKDGAKKSVEVAAELLRNGSAAEASELEQRARKSIDELKRGIERAAESVLGDDTEALRLAKRELDDLARQVEEEVAQANTNATQLASSEGTRGERGNNRNQGAQSDQNQRGQQGDRSDQAGEGGGQQDQTGQGRGERRSQTAEAQDQQQGEQAQGQGRSQSGNNGRGQRGQESQRAEANQQGQGRGQNQSGQRAEANQQGQPQGQQQGQGQGQGQSGERADSQPQQQQQQTQAGQRGGDQPNDQAARSGERAQGGTAGGRARRNFFDGDGRSGPENSPRAPLTGEDYAQWSDRLRDVEEMLDLPELRNQVAEVRERARTTRAEFKRHSKEPRWDLVKAQIVAPLAEVRERVTEELARRESKDSLVPIDRDPVPHKFSDLVRQYYERLGSSEQPQ